MPIGLRIGARLGSRVGPRIGSPVNGVTPTITTLTVAINDSVDPAITAVNYSYPVVVTNTGGVNAINVTCVVVLDAALTFVSASGTGWVCGNVGNTVTCTRATLAVGPAPTITVTATSGAGAATMSTTADADADNTSPAVQDIETTVIKLVTKDATRNVRAPANATEWTDFNAYHVAIGTANFPNVAPTSLYLCQEAAGNLADSIGANTLTAAGAPAYQQAVAGWSRKSVNFTVDTAAQRFTAVIVGFAPAAHSYTVLAYMAMTNTPAATRRVLAIGDGGTAGYVEHQLTTGNIALHVGSNTAISAATYTGTGVKAYLAKHNFTGSIQALYTDVEKLIPTFSSLTGTVQGIGASTGSATGQATLYMAAFADAAAEISDAGAKALLQALGFTIPWS